MCSFRVHQPTRELLWLFFAFIALLVLRPAEALAQAANAGTVSEVSGTAQLQRGAATIPVTRGMPVEVGDRIITGDDGHVVVLLTDQSTLELSDSSNLVITQHAGATSQVNLASGVVRSFVNRTVGAAAPNFEVHTPNAVAAARGTLFDTAYTSNVSRPTFGNAHNFTDVSVYDGSVDVANAANPTAFTNVPAGYESTVAGTNNATSPGPLGMTGAVSFSPAGSKGSPGSTGAITPVSTVPPPSCPVCVGPSIGPSTTMPPASEK
jgi:ferric-dicitrate binding protein FerR (iron transport regulator)